MLAKITLYQKAAANYHLTSDAAVKHWLANTQTYSDKERCVCVCVCVCVVCSNSYYDNVIVTIVTSYPKY